MVVDYANYLADRGHNVSLWYNINNTVFKIHPLIKQTNIPLPTKLGTVIHSLVTRFNSDAIIVDIIPLASLLSIRNRSRLIYFAQGFDESYHTNRIQKLLTKILYIFSLSIMKIRGIAVSNHLAHMLREKYNARTTVVENGIDLSKFYHDPDEELISSKDNRKSVLVLSRNDHAKGIDIAIDVVNKLTNVLETKIEVWICGEMLDNQFRNVKVKNFGWLGIEKLRKVLSSADVFFYPTRNEGLPLMPIEAMACGCPVVTTRAVSYAQDGENALVGEIEGTGNLRDKLEIILRDDLTRKNLQKNGFTTAAKFDLKKSREAFQKAIADSLKTYSGPSSDTNKRVSSSL
jgi:glycosyltransferase involved in cell wall biosynthesis